MKNDLESPPADVMAGEYFQDLPRHVIDQTDNVIYLLDGQLNISYCNPAWDRFALQNGGEKVVRTAVLGTNLRPVLPEALRPFYDDVFSMARTQTGMVTFDYECSSPELFRLFRMQVMFLRRSGGLAIINSLRVEQDHMLAGHVARPPGSQHYADASGIVTMCCHCRKTRRQGAENTWDWVPEHLKRLPLTVSHALCPVCEVYYYGKAALRPTRQDHV